MQKVLLTGATGFLGKQIAAELSTQSYEVIGLGRQSFVTISCNLATDVPVFTDHFKLVVHAAAKTHMGFNDAAQEAEFFKTNVEGTKHLCEAFDTMGVWPEAFVFISTVAVYGASEGVDIKETWPLNGKSAYAKSKIEAEAFLTGWCRRHDVRLSILRLPLIAGPNPPGNLGAMINGIKNNRYFNIGDGGARKSIVLASDVGKWIPAIAEVGGIYHLTDGYHPSFSELASLIAKQLGKSRVPGIPNWLALPIALAGDFLGSRAPINSDKLKKITATLTFDDSKARQAFGWDPRPVLEYFRIN